MSDAHEPSLHMDGAVATITLRRVAEHNRIDADDTAIVLGHLQRIRNAPEIAVLVITGEGHKTFCSGYTLEQIGTRLDQSFERMLDEIEMLDIPTICALNGSVYGGGTDLAISCDFRIGVRGSRLFMPAARFGLHYYPGGLRRFVARLGSPATKKIFLTGRTLDADELLRIGFLSDLVDADQLHVRVDEYIADILRCERQAVASMKEHIDAIDRGTWTEERGREAFERSLGSAQTRERLAALAGRKNTRHS